MPEEISKDWKTGVRIIGVSESFERGDKRSILTGVIMRGDRYIDGAGFCLPYVGGMDATDELISMYRRINRKDIHAWILGGSVISWFNIIDMYLLSESTNTPVICVTYHASDGLETYLKEYFPDNWKIRYEKLISVGKRQRVQLSNGQIVYLTSCGLNFRSASRLVDLFTEDGKIPEPIKVARIIAAALRRDLGGILSS